MQILPQIGTQIGNNLLQPPQPTAPTTQPIQANTNLFAPATVGGTTIGPQIGPSMVGDLQNIQNQPKYKQAFDQQILQTQAKEIKDVTQIASQPTRTQGLIPDFLAPKGFMTKKEQKLADTYYDSPRLYQGIMETMTSGQTQQQLTPYEQIIIRDLQTAIDNGLQPTPEEIMKAVPGIPRNVAFAIAKQEDKAPPMVQALNTIKQKYQQYKDAFNPLTPARQATQKLTGKSTLDFVDPIFKFKPIEKIEQDLTQAGVSEFFAKQLSSPIFSVENTARFVGNLPSALANMAIFGTNLFLDPETTVSEFMQGMSQIPAAISEEIPFYATPAEKVKGFVDGIAKFVVENPDVILAPESLIKGSQLARGLTKSPVGPGGAADVTIQAEVARRMKAQGLAPTVENVQKTANQLYDEMMSGSYTPEGGVPETATTTTTEARQPSTVYEGTIQGSEDIVPRPQVDYRETIPGVDKEIQEVFGQTIVGVKKPADVLKKTDQQISTMETILDNKDNLPMIFDDKGNVASDISVMKYAEGVSQTMDNFWQNVIAPVEQGLSDLAITPSTADIAFAVKSIDNSLESMNIAGQVSPIAKKAYDTLTEYKNIISSQNIKVSDLWKLSKELNQATQGLYNGATLSPANLRLQAELAGLNVIVREIFEKVVDNMLDVPELRDLKRQRGDMRGSIKQITKRGQVLDRKAPVGLTQTLGDAFGGASVIGGLISMNPAAIAQGIGLKLITDYIRNLNNPNKKLRKLLEKMDKQRQGFRVPGGFSEGSPVSDSIANKVQSQVSKKKAEAAAEKARQQIQREFVRRMKELETPALVVGGIEIMPDGTIKQQAVAPKPKGKTIIEIDTVSPAKEQAKIREMEQAELAKQNEIKERKQQEEIEKKKQEEQEAIERKKKYEEYKADLAKKMVEEQEKMAFEMLYEKAKSEGEVVQGADIFGGLQKGDVTPIGIVESTYVSGTKPIVEIKGEKFNPGDTRVYNQEVFRLPGDAEKRLDRNKIMIKDSLDETKTSPTDELSSFIEDMKQLNPETNYEVPQKELDNIQSREFMYDLMRKEDPKYQYFVNKAAQLAHMEQRLGYVGKNKIKVGSIRNDQEIEFLKRKENLLIELMDEYTNLDQVGAEEQLQRYMDAPVSHVTRQPKTSSYVSVAEKQQRALQRAEKFKRKVSEPEVKAEVAVAEKSKEDMTIDDVMTILEKKDLEPLYEEARKYKSAEEFSLKMPREIRKQLSSEKNIKSTEQIKKRWSENFTDKPEKLDTLNPTGSLFVEYTPKTRATMELGENITTLDVTMGKSPDDMITIYRGAPKIQKEIVPGDFITTLPELAKSYAGEGHVISKKVKLKDVLDDLSDPTLGEESIYRPSDKNKK